MTEASQDCLDELDLLSLHEVIRAAKARLDPHLWDYLIGGAETETTILRNRHALNSLAFRPRILRDVTSIDTSTSFFANPVRLPLILAPIGGLDALWPEGGVAIAQAASQRGVPFMMSSITQVGMEAIATAGSAPKALQLYLRGDDDFFDEQIMRAIDCGFDAVCLTVDTALYSRRERDISNRFQKPWKDRGTGIVNQAGMTWRDVERFKTRFDRPLFLKGISTAEDADIACQYGVDAVYVSNHGGRQLDHCRGTLDSLPEVKEAVAGRAKVIVDGGIGRGADVIKAIAQGADLVGVGRIYGYGLAAAGMPGVVRVLQLLEEEIRACMGLLGVSGISDLGPEYVCREDCVVPPGMHDGFPLLAL